MKLKLIAASLALCLFPVHAMAESPSNSDITPTFDSIDSCKSLQQEIAAAIEESNGLSSLLTDKSITQKDYLTQLYEGVKLLSKTGEMFFKASESHESDCKTFLKQAGKIEEIRKIYDWYLEPTQHAYQFFKRAREAAVSLNRQKDVDAFNESMTQFDAAIMKLVGVCESDLASTPQAATCTALSTKLSDILK